LDEGKWGMEVAACGFLGLMIQNGLRGLDNPREKYKNKHIKGFAAPQPESGYQDLPGLRGNLSVSRTTMP
jgi:hypothetical protein